MSLSDEGAALILVYCGDRRESVLLHEHDGGEAYMRPLLRKAVQYAKTHYGSGNIVDVLMSEGEMGKLYGSEISEVRSRVRHLYYVVYRLRSDMASKTYRVSALHMKDRHHYPIDAELPVMASGIPATARPIA